MGPNDREDNLNGVIESNWDSLKCNQVEMKFQARAQDGYTRGRMSVAGSSAEWQLV